MDQPAKPSIDEQIKNLRQIMGEHSEGGWDVAW